MEYASWRRSQVFQQSPSSSIGSPPRRAPYVLSEARREAERERRRHHPGGESLRVLDASQVRERRERAKTGAAARRAALGSPHFWPFCRHLGAINGRIRRPLMLSFTT